MRNANYEVVERNDDYLIIRDIGPWDRYMTITNAAEAVVAELVPRLDGRRLYYYDSEGSLDELVIENYRFHCFRSGGPVTHQP